MTAPSGFMPNYPSLSPLERNVFARLPRWQYERKPGGLRRVAFFGDFGGKTISSSVLKDVGRFLCFDGMDDVRGDSRIIVELNAGPFQGGISTVSRIKESLSTAVREVGRLLEFCLVISPRQGKYALDKNLTRLHIPLRFRWDGQNMQFLMKAVEEMQPQEVVLLLTPSWVESLERVMEKLVGLRVPCVYLQMEYGRRWNLYHYYVIEQALRRIAGAGWRTGHTIVRLREPMCRRTGGATYCGAGVTKVAIGSDGVLYPCHRFVGHRMFAIGTAELGFWPGVLRLYHYRPEQNEGCERCEIIPHCDTGCIWNNWWQNGRMDKTTSAVCEFAKMIYAGTP